MILAEGRGSELVRESAGIFSKNVSVEPPYSRTSPLPRLRAEASFQLSCGTPRRMLLRALCVRP
ncbi:hypothetical protein CVE34_11190 [Pseudomonas syringae pv. actinidiae]|nr:hypothetical protein [Pseudomonas syringae pv. actinidiae]NAT72756.1 hypothetical protein [Pseudomonas syringae pv. actinidiae]